MKKKTKTVPFCYRLKSGKLCFRLPINSPSQFLWNHYLAKKEKVKLAFFEIATLARERLNDKSHNETFILRMIAQLSSSDQKGATQKAHDRIFELALEQYSSLQRQGHGQVPVLLPQKETEKPLPFDKPLYREYLRQKRERQ